MQVTMMMAISADGFIATSSGDSDWVTDDELFAQAVKEYGCIIVGNKTFAQYQGDIYPIESIQHLVLTNQPTISGYKNVQFVTSPREAVEKAEELGFEKLLLIGGAQTNASFLKAGLVQTVLLDIHPLLLGSGIKLLDGDVGTITLEPTSSYQNSTGFMHCEYRVLKASN